MATRPRATLVGLLFVAAVAVQCLLHAHLDERHHESGCGHELRSPRHDHPAAAHAARLIALAPDTSPRAAAGCSPCRTLAVERADAQPVAVGVVARMSEPLPARGALPGSRAFDHEQRGPPSRRLHG